MDPNERRHGPDGEEPAGEDFLRALVHVAPDFELLDGPEGAGRSAFRYVPDRLRAGLAAPWTARPPGWGAPEPVLDRLNRRIALSFADDRDGRVAGARRGDRTVLRLGPAAAGLPPGDLEALLAEIRRRGEALDAACFIV